MTNGKPQRAKQAPTAAKGARVSAHPSHENPLAAGSFSTRAQASARSSEPLPKVVRLVPPDPDKDQRIPRIQAVVHLGGGIQACFTVARKRGPHGKLEVRPPVNRDGGAALLLPPALDEAVTDAIRAAIQADPEARDHLAAPRY
jgi:hypothetical protein